MPCYISLNIYIPKINATLSADAKSSALLVSSGAWCCLRSLYFWLNAPSRGWTRLSTCRNALVAAPFPPFSKLTNREVSKSHKTHIYTLSIHILISMSIMSTQDDLYTKVYYYSLVDFYQVYQFTLYVTVYTPLRLYPNIEYLHTSNLHNRQ